MDEVRLEGLIQNVGSWNAQGSVSNVIPSSLSPNASTSSSPPRGPITRSMMKKMHMGLSQDDQVNHGIFTLVTWAKEIYKI